MLVTAGLDPAVHHFEKMDTRVKPAYDELESIHAQRYGAHEAEIPWDSNAVSSDCPMSANRRCSTR
jgi:hypothetical protein